MSLTFFKKIIIIISFVKLFLLKYSCCTILYKLQVYNIVIYNFERLYFIYSCNKILAIFTLLYNISL